MILVPDAFSVHDSDWSVYRFSDFRKKTNGDFEYDEFFKFIRERKDNDFLIHGTFGEFLTSGWMSHNQIKKFHHLHLPIDRLLASCNGVRVSSYINSAQDTELSFLPAFRGCKDLIYEHKKTVKFRDKMSYLHRGPGIGYLQDGNVVIIGERPAKQNGMFDYPFCGNGGCSSWLNKKLDIMKSKEDKIYWVNAYNAEGIPTDPSFLKGVDVHVFALGNIASAWCLNHSIPHTPLYHPSYWMRFKNKEEYPLFNELRKLKKCR